jgi:hypothetical protein
MRITNRLALNREISVQVRERAYSQTWDRPRWADGAPIRTDRPGNPIPAAPRVPALPPVDEALARLERAAANATPGRTDAHGGPSVDQIIAARRRTIATGQITPTHVRLKSVDAQGHVITDETPALADLIPLMHQRALRAAEAV